MELKPHTLFLWIALVFGVANLVLNPPFMGVDEENHFARMLGFAQGNLFAPAQVSPAFAAQVEKETTRMRQFFGHEGRVGGRDFFSDQNNKFDFNDSYNDFLAYAPAFAAGPAVAFYPYNRAVIYPPTAYLFALPFASVAIQSGQNPLVILYILRAAILIAGTVLLYCAIRITPVLKWQFFLLALLQTSVFIRSNANADPHVFGYAFFFMALVLRAVHTQDVLPRRQLIVLGVLAVLLCLSKSAYLLLPGMFLMLDSSKFETAKQRMLSVFGVVALPMLLGLLWSWIAGAYYHDIPVGSNGYMERAPDVDEKAQILFCLSHPIDFLHSVLFSFAKLWPFYMGQLIAMQGDSQVDMSLPFDLLTVAVILFPMLAILPAVDSNNKGSSTSPPSLTLTPPKGVVASLLHSYSTGITLWQRCLCFALFIASALLICLMIYAGNTPVGAEEITGLQGRYFIPVLPLLFFAAGQNFTKKVTAAVHVLIIVYAVSILGYSVHSLLANNYNF